MRWQKRAGKALKGAAPGLFMALLAASPAAFPPRQVRQIAPLWVELPPHTAERLGAEGINAEKYGRLLTGQVLTERRPVPAGKSGAHVAALGIVEGKIDKLWGLLENCGQSPPIMPYLRSCRLIAPGHPLAPNKRWELLKIDFHLLCFAITTTMIDEDTLQAPDYLSWRQIRGEARINEGYFRIITIAQNTQLVVYDALVDPGPLLPAPIKEWLVRNTLPGIITALRDHVQPPCRAADHATLSAASPCRLPASSAPRGARGSSLYAPAATEPAAKPRASSTKGCVWSSKRAACPASGEAGSTKAAPSAGKGASGPAPEACAFSKRSPGSKPSQSILSAKLSTSASCVAGTKPASPVAPDCGARGPSPREPVSVKTSPSGAIAGPVPAITRTRTAAPQACHRRAGPAPGRASTSETTAHDSRLQARGLK